jgi:hypothetical protein
MIIAAKSEDLEFSPSYPGNFSKGDAQSPTMSFSVRPVSDAQQLIDNKLSGHLPDNMEIN